MQQRHVVHLRCRLRELQHCLVLGDLLRHGRRVWITDGNHIDVIVVRLLGRWLAFFGLVVVIVWCVVANDVFEQTQFFFEREVDACLHSRHNFQGALKDRQGRTNRRVGRHIADVKVSRICKATAVFNDLVQQLQQGLTWLLVWQRHQVVFDRTAWNINVTEFARGNRCIVTLNTHAARLETTGQVGQ